MLVVCHDDDVDDDLVVNVRNVTLQPIVNKLKHTQSPSIRDDIVEEAEDGLVDLGPVLGAFAEGRGLGLHGTHKGKPNLTLASLLKFPSSL